MKLKSDDALWQSQLACGVDYSTSNKWAPWQSFALQIVFVRSESAVSASGLYISRRALSRPNVARLLHWAPGHQTFVTYCLNAEHIPLCPTPM